MLDGACTRATGYALQVEVRAGPARDERRPASADDDHDETPVRSSSRSSGRRRVGSARPARPTIGHDRPTTAIPTLRTAHQPRTRNTTVTSRSRAPGRCGPKTTSASDDEGVEERRRARGGSATATRRRCCSTWLRPISAHREQHEVGPYGLTKVDDRRDRRAAQQVALPALAPAGVRRASARRGAARGTRSRARTCRARSPRATSRSGATISGCRPRPSVRAPRRRDDEHDIASEAEHQRPLRPHVQQRGQRGDRERERPHAVVRDTANATRNRNTAMHDARDRAEQADPERRRRRCGRGRRTSARRATTARSSACPAAVNEYGSRCGIP